MEHLIKRYEDLPSKLQQKVKAELESVENGIKAQLEINPDGFDDYAKKALTECANQLQKIECGKTYEIGSVTYYEIDKAGFNLADVSRLYVSTKETAKLIRQYQQKPKETASDADNESKRIDTDDLKKQFKSKFYGVGNSIDWFSRLIDDLKTLKTITDYSRVALMIFDSDYFRGNYSTFNKWLVDFCRIVNVRCPREKSPNKYKIADDDKLKQKFNYLL